VEPTYGSCGGAECLPLGQSGDDVEQDCSSEGEVGITGFVYRETMADPSTSVVASDDN
jgi:hypothetical protein